MTSGALQVRLSITCQSETNWGLVSDLRERILGLGLGLGLGTVYWDCRVDLAPDQTRLEDVAVRARALDDVDDTGLQLASVKCKV